MLSKSVVDTLGTNLFRDLSAFGPELVICMAIVGMLVLRLFKIRWHMSRVVLIALALAFGMSLLQWLASSVEPGEISWADGFDLPILRSEAKAFGGMLALDYLTCFLRLLLLGFGLLVTWLSILTGIPDRDDSADFYTLLLGGLLGMSLMASANHLLMVFIAVEMASLPSYGLAGFLKGRRQSSEAALKYVVYGGGASGIMLYGISLIAGRFGTGWLPDVAKAMQLQMTVGGGLLTTDNTGLLLGLVLILAGLGFKLSAVPFHFWCPDVFEGAAAEVGAFLSVASKAAALTLTGRLLLALTLDNHIVVQALPKTLGPALAIFAAVTATFGNLAAYAQTNLKRLLAYSTIAHAGYMLMGLAPMTADGLAAVMFYLAAYLFMNLGAFAIVAFLRNKTGSEDLSSFRGLIYRSPVLVILFAVFLLSLLGLPPLFGFAAKFQVFQALFKAGKMYGTSNPTLSYTMYGLLLVGGVNTVFSVFYYLKVLKVMVLESPLEEVEGQPAPALRLSLGMTVYGAILGIMVLVGGIFWNPLAVASQASVRDFQPAPEAAAPAAGGRGTVNLPGPGAPGPGDPKGKAKGDGKAKGKGKGPGG